MPGEENEAPSLGKVYPSGKRRTKIQDFPALNIFFTVFITWHHMFAKK